MGFKFILFQIHKLTNIYTVCVADVDGKKLVSIKSKYIKPNIFAATTATKQKRPA